tara:strand:- start:6 stop:197 length:192 start_codon:yes stop_codon:yes gene_type:complete
MNPIIAPMGTLAIVFALVSIWWIYTTLKEGRKAEAEIRDRKIEKTKNASVEEQKKRLNKLLDR